MAFHSSNFVKQNVPNPLSNQYERPNSAPTIQFWGYSSSTDSVATINTSGYFNNLVSSQPGLAPGVQVGDQIEVTASDRSTILVFTSLASGAVTTSDVIAGDITYPITVALGGTGDTSLTAYGTLVGGPTSTGPVQVVAPGTTGQALVSAGNAAKPAYGTLGVVGGGTGLVTATTAYAPLISGTSATGAFQVASTGLATTGYVLTTNGAASVPSFQALSSVAAAGNVVQVATGTLTAANVNAGYAAPVLAITVPAGKYAVVRSVNLSFVYGAAWTGGGVFALQYSNTVDGAGTLVSGTVAASAFTGLSANTIISVVGIALASSAATTYSGVNLYFSNQTQAFAGGAGSSINYTIEYFLATA